VFFFKSFAALPHLLFSFLHTGKLPSPITSEGQSCSSKAPMFFVNTGYDGGEYGINWDNCDEVSDAEVENSDSLRTICYWYWCDEGGCVRNPEGLKCSGAEVAAIGFALFIGVFVFLITLLFFLAFVVAGPSVPSSYKMLVLLLFVLTFSGHPPLTLSPFYGLNTRMTECDSVYPFEVSFERNKIIELPTTFSVISFDFLMCIWISLIGVSFTSFLFFEFRELLGMISKDNERVSQPPKS
jgi:hypothetical protein